MNPFQVVLIIIVALLLGGTLVAVFNGWATKREGVVWALVWIAAGVAVIWPQVTTHVARTLGIGRGTDLLLYCAVVVMMVGFFMVYSRIRRLRRELTLLVRHLAIRDAVIQPLPANKEPQP